MESNLQVIEYLIDYIETHLDTPITLDTLAAAAGYSKYHLHRMFSGVTGCPVYAYIKNRKLTEAARALIDTDTPIVQIALAAGYETQQSFSTAFKAGFKRSPQHFRKRGTFFPLQQKFILDHNKKLMGGILMHSSVTDIKLVESGSILLVGYRANTKKGFSVIGNCWKKLHASKEKIENRITGEYLVGLNDYSSDFTYENDQPGFDYYAAAEVSSAANIPEGMEMKTLPKSNYVVFKFWGKAQDSLQPIVEYVYLEWFPASTYSLNEGAKYDFARYGELSDKDGNNHMEFWVPVL